MKPAIALCLISYTCGMLYVILTFFTGWLVYFDELWITLGFLIGLVLLILWRVKQRGKVWCTVSALLLVCSVLFGCIGIYNAYFRPKSAPIDMTEQEITEFCDYLLRDDNFQKEFLPACDNTIFVDEAQDGEPAGTSKSVYCFIDSELRYTLYAYADAESAQAAFAETADVDEPNATLVEREDYTVVFAPVKWESYYFNWNEGYRSTRSIALTCVHDRYIITYREAGDFGKPRFYKMAEQELFFDLSYEPFDASLYYSG